MPTSSTPTDGTVSTTPVTSLVTVDLAVVERRYLAAYSRQVRRSVRLNAFSHGTKRWHVIRCAHCTGTGIQSEGCECRRCGGRGEHPTRQRVI